MYIYIYAYIYIYIYLHCVLCLATLPKTTIPGSPQESLRSSKMNRRAEFWCGCGTNGKAYSDDRPQAPFGALARQGYGGMRAGRCCVWMSKYVLIPMSLNQFSKVQLDQEYEELLEIGMPLAGISESLVYTIHGVRISAEPTRARIWKARALFRFRAMDS